MSVQLGYAQNTSTLIDEYVNSYVKTSDYNGCIMIAKNDNVIYQNCFGMADHSFDVENTNKTCFMIGSVSKQITAAAVLMMEQEGLLNTSDQLSKFYPKATKVGNVTIEQLLNHTSGITDIYNIPNFNKLSCQKLSISDLVQSIIQTDLDFEPGTGYQYSNGGYAILADIIEKRSGTSYEEYLSKNIFYTLNMNSTGHRTANEVVQNLAIGYDPLAYDKLKTTDFIDHELLKGSGSLYSTVDDLHKWVVSIKNRALLTEASYNKFLNNYGNNYGYGISLYTSFDQSVFGHDGRVNGFIADYLHYIDSNTSIIILGNIQTGVADFFRRDIAAIVFEKEYQSRAKTVLPSKEAEGLNQDILGTYGFGPNFNVYVEYLDNTIQARANEGGYSELILLEDGRYFSRTLYSYIKFVEDDQGKIIKMLWINNDGNSFEGLKK